MYFDSLGKYPFFVMINYDYNIYLLTILTQSQISSLCTSSDLSAHIFQIPPIVSVKSTYPVNWVSYSKVNKYTITFTIIVFLSCSLYTVPHSDIGTILKIPNHTYLFVSALFGRQINSKRNNYKYNCLQKCKILRVKT